MKAFKSLLEFQKHFSTDEKCRHYLELQRWGGTPSCVFCGSVNVTRLKDGKRFQCNEKECRKQFTVTVGTFYENIKLPLNKLYLAVYILSTHSKGISSLQLASFIGVTQKTAWLLNHKIREMLKENNSELLSGTVEIDETYIGGSESNKHLSKRTKNGYANKTMVLGAVQRKGKVKLKVIPQTNIENIQATIGEFVQPNSTMVTDEHHAYNKVHLNYNHQKVHHRSKEYVRGNVHTNNIEGYWNILKKQIVGIHHSVSPKHLQRYCNESAFRFNNRQVTQDERFASALTNCEGSLKYRQLIANG